VHVELPEVGESFDKGESFGAVESMKAASDVYLPVGGEVTAINESLEEDPGLVNSSMEEGWFVKITLSDSGELDALMDEAAYAKHCEESE